MTDINYLLHRQQIALFKAGRAENCDVRKAHEGMARAYRDQVLDYARVNREAWSGGRAS